MTDFTNHKKILEYFKFRLERS